MSLTGKIQSLFLDREKTQPIFPITKVNAVSDENGTGLNVLLDDINTELDGKASVSHVEDTNNPHEVTGDQLAGIVPITLGGTQASFPAGARRSLHIPFTTPLYVVNNTASFKIVGDSTCTRKIAVKVILAHQQGYTAEVMFVINAQTGAPIGTTFCRWGSIKVTSLIYSTTDNVTTYTVTLSKGGAYAMGSINFTNFYATNSGHDGEKIVQLDAYQYLHDLAEGTALTEAALV